MKKVEQVDKLWKEWRSMGGDDRNAMDRVLVARVAGWFSTGNSLSTKQFVKIMTEVLDCQRERSITKQNELTA